MKVLIVGAGPTGLTAAVELARLGVEVHVIEKRKSGSGLSRAVGIMPASLDLLEPSGVSEHLRSEGIKFRKVRVFNRNNLILELPISSGIRSDEFILGLPQDRTEFFLRKSLETLGGKLEFNSNLAGFVEHADFVEANLEDGRTTECNYLIGADGIGSTVRKVAGINFPGFDLPETWSIADVYLENWPHADAFVGCKVNGGKVVVVVPLEAARCRIISNTPSSLDTLPLPVNISKIRRQGTFKISIRQAETYQSSRVFIAGDAAHCHSPVGGRGMNIGIADAVNLAQKIASGDVSGYSQERHREGKILIAGTEGARKFVTSPSPVAHIAFLGLATAVNWLTPLQRTISRRILYG